MDLAIFAKLQNQPLLNMLISKALTVRWFILLTVVHQARFQIGLDQIRTFPPAPMTTVTTQGPTQGSTTMPSSGGAQIGAGSAVGIFFAGAAAFFIGAILLMKCRRRQFGNQDIPLIPFRNLGFQDDQVWKSRKKQTNKETSKTTRQQKKKT